MISRSPTILLSTCKFSSRSRRSMIRAFSQMTGTTSVGNEENKSNGCHDQEKLPFIPTPTWSVESLELTSKHEKLPADEMRRLSRRALLNLDEMPQDLEQDLANMMHMVQQVSAFVADPCNEQLFQKIDENSAFQYDFVRGVTAAPLRTKDCPLDTEDVEEAAQVWDTYLEHKTIRQGGSHKYFVISTKQIE